MRIGYLLAREGYDPGAPLRQARVAEEAGFEALSRTGVGWVR